MQSPPIARLTRIDVAWLCLIVVAVLAIYLPGLANLPVFDDAYLTDGKLRAEYASLDLRARMVSYGSFVWVEAIFGAGWWKQRVVNVLLHLGVVLATWAFYREVLRHISFAPAGAADESGRPALWFAIGFFALNPVAVYAVAYLIQRSVLMATLFTMLALWMFARALSTRRPGPGVAALAFYALAVMSKEHALFAPLAAIPVYLLVARPAPLRLAMFAAVGLAIAALVGVVLAVRYGAILGRPFDEYSHVYLAQLARLDPGAEKNAFALSIVNQAWQFFEYGLRWLLPWSGWMSINLRPPFPLSAATFPQVLGPLAYLATLAGSSYLLLRYRDGRALAGLALLMPALLFATEFVTVWVQDPFVLYRSYLWAIGVPGLVVFLVHGASPRALAIAGVIVGSLLVWQALDRVISLGTPQAAWSDAIAKLPRDERAVGRWFPYLNRGTAYVEANQFNLAMKDFEASAELGDMGMGSFNGGSLLAARGQHAEALAAFERAAAAGYNLYNLPFQRGLSLAVLGRPAEAYAQFEAARMLNPPSPTRELMLANLARLALQLGKPAEAIERAREWQAAEPGAREPRQLLGMAHVMRNEHAEALAVFDRLVAEGGGARAHYGRALAHFGLRQKAQALADIDAAIRIGPDGPHLQQWRARIAALP